MELDRRDFLKLTAGAVVVGTTTLMEACQQTPTPAPVTKPEAPVAVAPALAPSAAPRVIATQRPTPAPAETSQPIPPTIPENLSDIGKTVFEVTQGDRKFGMTHDQYLLSQGKAGYGISINKVDERTGIIRQTSVPYYLPPLTEGDDQVPRSWRHGSTLFASARNSTVDQVPIKWTYELTLTDNATKEDIAVLSATRGSLLGTPGKHWTFLRQVWYPNRPLSNVFILANT